MSNTKKRDLVDAAYELLKTTSPKDITARLIADKAGCTNPIIYYYFDNLDHLLLLASARFYEEYLTEVNSIISDENVSPYDLHMQAWRVFAKIAFSQVEIYDMLFWGKFRCKAGEGLAEYYQLFPERHPNLGGSYSMVFFMDDVVERTYLVLKMAASEGEFPSEGLHMFAEIQCAMFRSVLLEYVNTYRDPAQAQAGLERSMKLLEFLNSLYRIA